MSRTHSDSDAEVMPRLGGFVVGLLVVLAYVTGGGSQDHGIGDALTQLLAIPVLVWAMFRLAAQANDWRVIAAIVVALAIALLPALQLLPLPGWAWTANDARAAMQHELTVAGVTAPGLRWSLAPLATEHAIWSALPALATFLGAMAVGPETRRGLMKLILALAAGNVLLGLMQLGMPQDSLLNPFPQWAPAFGGVFANPNHQATSLVIALVISAGLFVDARRYPAHRVAPVWLLGTVAVLCMATLPLSGSRAGMIIGMLALVAVLVGVKAVAGAGRSRRTWLGVIGALAIAGLGVFSALQWIQVDAVEEFRQVLTRATFEMGREHTPWGSGVGSFVPIFEQGAPVSLRTGEYINHAHNDFVQWWLEGGLPALLAVAAVLVLLSVSLVRALRTSDPAQRAVAVPALVAVLAVLAHSLVDYPLRTPALMTLCAMLAGIGIAGTVSARGLQGQAVPHPRAATSSP